MVEQRTICLNADVGELPGAEGRSRDAAILEVVTRCSIACGGHAGDAESMAATVRAARARGVLVGAHPSYPDREGFGRARPNVTRDQLHGVLAQQVADLAGIASALEADITHIKPHGSLYNDAAQDRELAGLIASVCAAADIPCLIGPPGSELEAAARANGLSFLAEGFADRAYQADGSLVPRTQDGAVIYQPALQAAQAVMLALSGQVRTIAGDIIPLSVETICLHGDTPGAAANAALLREALERAGIRVSA